MKRKLLLILAFLLVAGALFALNPFLGEWICDQDRYLITETQIVGIMDGIPYETNYTYTDQVWTWKDRTWVYRVIDTERILLVSILPREGGFAPGYWVIRRIHRESPGA